MNSKLNWMYDDAQSYNSYKRLIKFIILFVESNANNTFILIYLS